MTLKITKTDDKQTTLVNATSVCLTPDLVWRITYFNGKKRNVLRIPANEIIEIKPTN